MSKNLDNTLLFDIYSQMLTERQRETLDLYYNEDLSLAEISETHGVTRQGVMMVIKEGEKKLYKLENAMKLKERFLILREKTDKLTELIKDSDAEEKQKMLEITDEIKTLL